MDIFHENSWSWKKNLNSGICRFNLLNKCSGKSVRKWQEGYFTKVSWMNWTATHVAMHCSSMRLPKLFWEKCDIWSSVRRLSKWRRDYQCFSAQHDAPPHVRCPAAVLVFTRLRSKLFIVAVIISSSSAASSLVRGCPFIHQDFH